MKVKGKASGRGFADEGWRKLGIGRVRSLHEDPHDICGLWVFAKACVCHLPIRVFRIIEHRLSFLGKREEFGEDRVHAFLSLFRLA